MPSKQARCFPENRLRTLRAVVSTCDGCWSLARSGGTDPPVVDTLVVDGSFDRSGHPGPDRCHLRWPDVIAGHAAKQRTYTPSSCRNLRRRYGGACSPPNEPSPITCYDRPASRASRRSLIEHTLGGTEAHLRDRNSRESGIVNRSHWIRAIPVVGVFDFVKHLFEGLHTSLYPQEVLACSHSTKRKILIIIGAELEQATDERLR